MSRLTKVYQSVAHRVARRFWCRKEHLWTAEEVSFTATEAIFTSTCKRCAQPRRRYRSQESLVRSDDQEILLAR